ncbi:MAG: hydrogenase maturation nickel metallochaperone HypA [Deltaproteobacteria bacterium]
MHEFGIASEIVRGAVEEARRQGAGKVTAVTVRIGVLRGVEPESLRLFYEHLRRGTIASEAPLIIEEEPVEIDCKTCGTLPGESFRLSCPSCGRDGIRVSGGDALRLASIEIEEPDPGDRGLRSA